MWFSLLLVIFGALYDNLTYLQGLIDPKIYGASFIIVGVITAILRFLTKGPIDY
jgi:hypothetical protein